MLRFLPLCFGLLSMLPAQQAAERPAAPAPKRFSSLPVPDAEPVPLTSATAAAIKAMLALAEGEDQEQWPYEGVYREDRGQLPVGYRVGGTAIVCLGLLAAPGYRHDAERQAAVQRGLDFVLQTLAAPRMQDGFVGNYDVRGWGHIYALELLLQLQRHGLVPAAQEAAVAERSRWLVSTLCAAAIPQAGGWNYSLPQGFRNPRNKASTFMTAPALQALFLARAMGHEVPAEVVEQALNALERARAEPGGYAYGAPARSQQEVGEEKLSMMDKTPGSAARATACEATLLLAGRGDQARLRTAVERFFQHWDDLAIRKSQTGTHIPPYGIAPYYFLYAHVYAAQAIELLPATERPALRARLQTVLWRSREADGSWNDRQFLRSAGYGTAMAVLSLHMPQLPARATWSVPPATPPTPPTDK